MEKYYKEIKGDLLESDCDVICHQTNTLGVMGGGIALQIKERYPSVYKVYSHTCFDFGDDELLGKVQIIFADRKRLVCNMFAQNRIAKGGRNTNYEAFAECLDDLYNHLDERTYFEEFTRVKIGFPKYIGCGLAGGDWDIIEVMINKFAKRVAENDIDAEIIIVEFAK